MRQYCTRLHLQSSDVPADPIDNEQSWAGPRSLTEANDKRSAGVSQRHCLALLCRGRRRCPRRLRHAAGRDGVARCGKHRWVDTDGTDWAGWNRPDGTRWRTGCSTAGCDVAVYNRTRAKAEPLGRAAPASSTGPPTRAAADIVFVTVGASRGPDRRAARPAGADVRRPRPRPDRGGLLHGLGRGLQAGPGAAGRARHRAARRAGHGQPQGGRGGTADAGGVRPARRVRRGPRPTWTCSAPAPPTSARARLARIVKLCHNLLLGVVTQSLAEVTDPGPERAASVGRRCWPA